MTQVGNVNCHGSQCVTSARATPLKPEGMRPAEPEIAKRSIITNSLYQAHQPLLFKGAQLDPQPFSSYLNFVPR